MIRSMLEPATPPQPPVTASGLSGSYSGTSPYGQAATHQPVTSSRLPAYNGAYNSMESSSSNDYFSPTSFSAGGRQPPASNYYHQHQHQQPQHQQMNGFSNGHVNGYRSYTQSQQNSYYHGGFQQEPTVESQFNKQSRFLPSLNTTSDYSVPASTSFGGVGADSFTPGTSSFPYEQVNAVDSGFLSPSGTSGIGGDTARSSTQTSNSESSSFGKELAHFDQFAQSSQYDSQFAGFSGLSVNIPESSAAVTNDVVLSSFLSSSSVRNSVNIAKEDSSFEEGTTGKECRDDSSEERLSCHSVSGLYREESSLLQQVSVGEENGSHFPKSLTSLSSSSNHHFDINHLDESLLYSFSSLSIPNEISTSSSSSSSSEQQQQQIQSLN
jgi:hypothetical protein